MDWWISIFASIIGYLFGSISSARLVARRYAPGTELSLIRQPIPNTDIVFESDSVSASMVRMQVGTRYGCQGGTILVYEADPEKTPPDST